MNGLRRAAVPLLAIPALLFGSAPAVADAPDHHRRERTHGLWSVTTRNDTVSVKFSYARPPDEDYPLLCQAALDDGRPLIAEIWFANHATVVFYGVPPGENTVRSSCEDSDGVQRRIGSIAVSMPGPPTSHFVATKHFIFDDD